MDTIPLYRCSPLEANSVNKYFDTKSDQHVQSFSSAVAMWASTVLKSTSNRKIFYKTHNSLLNIDVAPKMK